MVKKRQVVWDWCRWGPRRNQEAQHTAFGGADARVYAPDAYQNQQLKFLAIRVIMMSADGKEWSDLDIWWLV